MKIRISPPLLYQIIIILMILSHILYPVRKVIHFPFNLVGIILFVWGVWFALKAKRLFKASGIPIKPTETPVRIISSGPFRFSRNPMYLGITIGLFGIALFLGSLSTLFLPVIFFLIMNFIHIPFEEQMLAKTLSQEWDEYKSKVRRWI